MALSPRLDLRQSQSLVMTPQMQQAIKLLALSSVEIEAYISEAIEKTRYWKQAAMIWAAMQAATMTARYPPLPTRPAWAAMRY